MINITVNGTPYSVPSSASDTNWAASQVAFQQGLAAGVNTALAGIYTPGTWTSLTLLNSWLQGSITAQYRKDSAGVVWLKGTPTKAAGVGFVIANLPAGFRPAVSTYFTVVGNAEGGSPVYGSVIITNGGDIIAATATTNSGMGLGQVYFATF